MFWKSAAILREQHRYLKRNKASYIYILLHYIIIITYILLLYM
jgi:hypothetical protein